MEVSPSSNPDRTHLPRLDPPPTRQGLDLSGKSFWGTGTSLPTLAEHVLPYWYSNALYHDRDQFSRDHVLPWLSDQFPTTQDARLAIDLASSHGISATALANHFPQLVKIECVDRSEGALALGDYLVGNMRSIGHIDPDHFKPEVGGIFRFIDKGTDIPGLLRAHRAWWTKELLNRAQISFHHGDLKDLSAFPDHSFDLANMAMGWHWAVKSGNPDQVCSEILRILHPGGIFCSYVFGLADEFAWSRHRRGRYLTDSPILRGMYQALEDEIGSPGLADAISARPQHVFEETNGKSGLLSYFESKSGLRNVKYTVLECAVSPEVCALMARTQTAAHSSHLAFKVDSPFLAALKTYSSARNLSEEEGVIHAVRLAYAKYVASGGLDSAISNHIASGPYFELLPTVAWIKS